MTRISRVVAVMVLFGLSVVFAHFLSPQMVQSQVPNFVCLKNFPCSGSGTGAYSGGQCSCQWDPDKGSVERCVPQASYACIFTYSAINNCAGTCVVNGITYDCLSNIPFCTAP